MTEFDTLKRLMSEVEVDMPKVTGGNKAAGTRVRKKMQEVKAAAHDLRKQILTIRTTDAVADVSAPVAVPVATAPVAKATSGTVA